MKERLICWLRKNWKCLCIIAAILIFLVNILLACIFRDEGANIFTAISGWISGIATALIGFIAYWQNQKYNLTACKNQEKEKIRAERSEYFLEFFKFNKYGFYANFWIDIMDWSPDKYYVFRKNLGITKNGLLYELNKYQLDIQVYEYINEHKVYLIKKINELKDFISLSYQMDKEEFEDIKKRSQKIVFICRYIRKWIGEMDHYKSAIRRTLNLQIEKIETARNISDIEECLKHIKEKDEEVQKEIRNIYEQRRIEKTLKKKQEKVEKKVKGND